MEEKALPVKHLSARVPWHDNKWNGTFCCNVLDNSFCRILPRVDDTKDESIEPDGEKITDENLPPCIAEKGTFLSPHEYTRDLNHAWKDINPMYKEFLPGIYHHKPYSFNAVPFLWMLKAKGNLDPKELERDRSLYPHKSLKAEVYELDYIPELEEEIDKNLGFSGNTWVQHAHNQKVLLDAFFRCLKKDSSLIFFYSKHTPLSEPNERIIVGVAKVRSDIGQILNYNYPPGYKGHKGHPWDRCIEHTLTPKNTEGFILPYHELIEYAEDHDIDLADFKVVAPSFDQFSFASELVEHDTAIDALLNMVEVLKKSEIILEKSFREELSWIDREISKVWDMRGAFPGMGAVLSALKIESSNTIAWEIEKYIQETDGDLYQTNPWEIFEESVSDPEKYIKARGTSLFSPTVKSIWKTTPKKKKRLLELLSRIQLNNDQAATVLNNQQDWIGSTDEILENPYLLYEKTRYYFKGLLSFKQLDKALMPPAKIKDAFPLSEPSNVESQLDERRLRAAMVWILEESADQGHSLLTSVEALVRLEEKSLDTPLPISKDTLDAIAEEDYYSNELLFFTEGKTGFVKLQRLEEIKAVIKRKINKERIIRRTHNIEHDWLSLVNDYPDLPKLDSNSPDYEAELLARKEKSEALKILTNYRFSVLIGPAGSGKTTLLKIFENIPEIKRGGVLKLAPTGKARVKLGHDAFTIAQFLYPDRYDSYYGIYWLNPDAQKASTAKTVIIDESSMLTEEQLAAVFDALGPVDRIILVGDYRQLPPIGTGRPFVDIVDLFKPDSFPEHPVKVGAAYAELCQISRQSSDSKEHRLDVQLSKCFGDEVAKEDIDLFHALSTGEIKSSHIRLEKWYDSKDFKELFEKVLKEELDIEGDDVIKAFNRTLGAVDSGDFQYFNNGYSEKQIENWQIISPVNGFGYGVKEVNKFIQTTYRKNFIDLAHKKGKKRIAKPKGVDNMVYGDKVINLNNSRWENWQWINPSYKKSSALNYIANGEIGVITGKFRGNNDNSKGEPQIEIAFSTQPGYSYVYWPNQFGEDSLKSYKFDLAYAITVHKAQGSGFKKVFFVLPSKGAILSRELLYTALTRQEDKIIILHQGEFRDFIRLASTDASATARRFTDLFFLPDVKQIDKKFYDARYINVSERGERMISKNEVIIANCLNKYKDRISYAYEDKLTLEGSGRTIKPDFTIENLDTGRIFYWEHLGMLTKEEYREKWNLKLQGYLDDGFVLHSKADYNDDKVLILTEENPNGGIDSQYFDQLVREVILEE